MPRKLIESTFITLDGVISNPHHYGAPYWDDEHNAYGARLMDGTDALLLGARPTRASRRPGRRARVIRTPTRSTRCPSTSRRAR